VARRRVRTRESLNSAWGCGHRSKAKMIIIIYLIVGKLPLPQIHTI
jgi:hypothetical protein